MHLTTNEFLKVAGKMFPGFKQDEYNKDIIQMLIWYVNRDTQFEDYLKSQNVVNPSIDKALCFMGNVGSGKSSLLYVLQKCLSLKKHPLGFRAAWMPDIADSFGETGFKAFHGFEKDHWLLDEVGKDKHETIIFYGNKMNIADAMISSCYEVFRKYQKLFHITTNKNKEELQRYLDERAYSRLTEMSNFIPVVGPDRRATAKPKRIPMPVVESEMVLSDFDKKVLRVVYGIEMLQDELINPSQEEITLSSLIAKSRHEVIYTFLKDYKILTPVPERMIAEYEKSKQLFKERFVTTQFEKHEWEELNYFHSEEFEKQTNKDKYKNRFYRIVWTIVKKTIVLERVAFLKEMEISPREYVLDALNENGFSDLASAAIEKLEEIENQQNKKQNNGEKSKSAA